jgi:hypothetical protein
LKIFCNFERAGWGDYYRIFLKSLFSGIYGWNFGFPFNRKIDVLVKLKELKYYKREKGLTIFLKIGKWSAVAPWIFFH